MRQMILGAAVLAAATFVQRPALAETQASAEAMLEGSIVELNVDAPKPNLQVRTTDGQLKTVWFDESQLTLSGQAGISEVDDLKVGQRIRIQQQDQSGQQMVSSIEVLEASAGADVTSQAEIGADADMSTSATADTLPGGRTDIAPGPNTRSTFPGVTAPGGGLAKPQGSTPEAPAASTGAEAGAGANLRDADIESRQSTTVTHSVTHEPATAAERDGAS